ncbi:MAG: imidazole glycerol phosphate synthase subunit HisH [Epsilonproteobacteria bacterium]|nr:imidazole glycerol phosphate synthase subunit HisH [Campylobacterota bacterium]
MIAIIDYNMGNLASVINAFDKIAVKAEVVSEPSKLRDYDKIILPGVGAFADAMQHLNSNGMKEAILEFAKSGKYMLGICLGMQLLFEKSQEFGHTQGLCLIEGEVDYFRTSLKVPHMGWNKMFTKTNPLFEGLKDPYLYFVHSLHAVCDDQYVIGYTHYDYQFVSAVNKDNIFGFQPHPEKSHDSGLQILSNFVRL